MNYWVHKCFFSIFRETDLQQCFGCLVVCLTVYYKNPFQNHIWAVAIWPQGSHCLHLVHNTIRLFLGKVAQDWILMRNWIVHAMNKSSPKLSKSFLQRFRYFSLCRPRSLCICVYKKLLPVHKWVDVMWQYSNKTLF
jgi:hypothetical protein